MLDRVRKPSPAMVVALIALFVAMGGAAMAGKGLITGKKIKNESVTGKDTRNGSLGGGELADGSVSGAKVDESSLGQVPAASDAAKLDGIASSGYLKAAGCQTGKVNGFALVRGQGGAGLPTSYSSSSAIVSSAHNCTGGTVQAKRQAIGQYSVRFTGNPAELAVATVRAQSVDGEDQAGFASVRRVAPGEFQIYVYTSNGSTWAARDADVAILVP